MRCARVLELGSTKPPLLLSRSHLIVQGMDTPLEENFLRLLHALLGSGSATSHIGCGEEGARHRTAITQKAWIRLQLLGSKHQLHLLVPFLSYPPLFWGKRPHDDQRSHGGHLQPPARHHPLEATCTERPTRKKRRRREFVHLFIVIQILKIPHNTMYSYRVQILPPLRLTIRF